VCITNVEAQMALGVDGMRVGIWEHASVPTGCTVVLAPAGTLGAVAIRGQAPGTREAAALGPHGKLNVIHGVLLAGGSGYGLAAADGVMRWLEEQGIGYPVGDAIVPIVGGAIVLDLSVGVRDARPDAAGGWAACEAASEADPPDGAVGAGAGCTVAKVAGFEHAWRGGQAIATERHGDLVVTALIVNNAVGEIIGEDGQLLVASSAPAEMPRWPRDLDRPGQTPSDPDAEGPSGNTVIGVIATNAKLDKSQAYRVADLAHDGVARAVEPAHTSVDGDALFCLATGVVDTTVDRVAQLAVAAVARATRNGPMAAVSLTVSGGPFGDQIRGRADTAP
jgi:L-aminopeptidase/D-esterase-like protein